MRYSSTRESYSEVYEIINFLGDEYINKIPKKLYEFIEKNRDPKYKTKFSKTKLENISEKKFSRKAVAIIAFLNLNYWEEDEEKKKKLENIYVTEQQRFEQEVVENYDDEFVCNSKPSIDVEESILPEKYKENIFKIIVKKIKNLLKKED